MLSKILFGSLAIAANAQDQTIDAEKVEHMYTFFIYLSILKEKRSDFIGFDNFFHEN